MTNKQLGNVVEKFAANYLIDIGFNILDRNIHYWGGEIDIVSEKNGILHFIEVKCRKSGDEVDYDPISNKQVKTLRRSIDLYLMSKDIIAEWQLDLFVVYFNGDRVSNIKIFEDIIFDYDY